MEHLIKFLIYLAAIVVLGWCVKGMWNDNFAEWSGLGEMNMWQGMIIAVLFAM